MISSGLSLALFIQVTHTAVWEVISYNLMAMPPGAMANGPDLLMICISANLVLAAGLVTYVFLGVCLSETYNVNVRVNRLCNVIC